MARKKNLYVMTEEDIRIIGESANDPNILLNHFFKKPGQKQGWQLDYNFTDDGKWQESMVMATQSFIVAINGIATGKTLGVIMGAAYFGILTPSFKFMNVAPEAFQSMLMYKAILEQAEGTLFEKLIISKPTRPYPHIDIAFVLGEEERHASFEFMCLGIKGNSTNIFSWRGDWINVDEAGLIKDLEEVVGNLSTRLTGVTAQGRQFIGRLTVISNPWDEPELWELFDLALSDPETGLAFNIDTESNKNVGPKQVKMAYMLIPERNRSRYLTGGRPEGQGIYFSREKVIACEDLAMGEIVKKNISQPVEGWDVVAIENLGVMKMIMPRQQGHIYYLLGDPGVGSAPRRNAPTIAVLDVTNAPYHAPVVGFWWGNGGGTILTFVHEFVHFIELYAPALAGVDNTGPQRGTAELMNANYIYGKGLSITSIVGLDFSGQKKYSLLGALRIALESLMITWPAIIKGISSQLKKYDPILDQSENSKLAQDIVCVLAMAAFTIYGNYPAKGINANDSNNGKRKNTAFKHIRNFTGRSNRSSTRSPRNI